MAAIFPSSQTSEGNVHMRTSLDDFIEPDEDPLDEAEDPLHTSDRAPLTGKISSRQLQENSRTANNAQGYLNSALQGEDRRAALNTIEESVWQTVRRDLLAIWEKLREVLYPQYLFGGSMLGGGNARTDGLGSSSSANALDQIRRIVNRLPDADAVLQNGMAPGLRDWDLWGPLLFCLLLSFFLSLNAQSEQKELVFSGVFATIWIAEAVVTLQIKLLGGTISFFQSISVIGYTLFPLAIAALLSALRLTVILRIPIYSILGLWSLAAGISILGGSGVVKNRVALAVYPLLVFYIGLGCLCFIS